VTKQCEKQFLAALNEAEIESCIRRTSLEIYTVAHIFA